MAVNRCRQFCVVFAWLAPQRRRPIEVIEDNSFLIEEAYNQEPGVVQHIFTAAYTISGLATARMDIQFHPGMAGVFPGSSVFLHDAVLPFDR